MRPCLCVALLVWGGIGLSECALGGEPPAPGKAARTDSLGDPLPDGAIARLGTTRLRQPDCDCITALALSPDDKIIASAGGMDSWEGQVLEEPYRIRLWDAATGKELRRFGGHTISITGIAFSPDGKRLASAEIDGVRVWDVATGKTTLEVGEKAIRTEFTPLRIAFSPDGKRLAADGGEKGIHLLDAATGTIAKTWTVGYERTRTLAFSPDGKLLCALMDTGIHIWDVAAEREVLHVGGKTKEETVASVVFAPDGKSLVTGWGDGSVRLWDIAGNKKTLEFEKIAGSSGDCVAITHDGKSVAAEGPRGSIILWDAATGKQTRRLRGHADAIAALVFSRDGKTLVSTGADRTIIVWDVATGKERLLFETHRGPIESLSFSPDGRTLASASQDGTIRLWDVATAKTIRRLCELEVPVWCVRHSPDGRLLAASANDRLRLWEAGTGKEVRSFHPDGPFAFAFSPGGKALALAGDGALFVCDVRTGKEVLRIAGRGKLPLTEVAFSPNGDMIAAACGENRVHLWAASDGKPLGSWVGGEKYRVDSILFSADGRGAAASGHDGATYLWDTATGKELPQFTRYRDHDSGEFFGGTISAFSPDGRLLATGDLSGPVNVYEVLTGDRVAQFDVGVGGSSNEVRALAFSPDGRLLATGTARDCAIHLWDMTGFAGRAPARLTPEALEVCWSEVGSNDSAKAHRAIWVLASAAEQSVSFITERLHPVPVADAKTLERWIADLDSEDFTTREKAHVAIAALREGAATELRKAMKGQPSAEVSRHLEALLADLGPLSGKRLCEVRGVAVLEHAATPKARAALESLAKGAPKARLTQDAKAALERLVRRTPEQSK